MTKKNQKRVMKLCKNAPFSDFHMKSQSYLICLRWGGCRLALRIDRFFVAKDGEDGEFVLNHENAHQNFLNIWSGKPKIEVR